MGFDMVVRRLFALALLFVLAASSLHVQGKSDTLMGEEKDLYIEWDPHILTLAPGEEGETVITVHNLRRSQMMVGIRWNYIDGPGGPDGEVSPNYFSMGPREETDVTVSVRSRTQMGVSECASDVRLTFYWGPNLTKEGTSDDRFDRDSADGEEDLQIHIVDDFSGSPSQKDEDTLLSTMVILLLILVIAVLLVMIARRGKQDRS
jgi:hypothetical protein